MWKPLIRCSIVGGIIVFLWMMISWTVLPFHKMVMNPVADESRVTAIVLEETPKDGVYVIPYFMGQDKPPQDYPTSTPFIFMNVKRGVNFQDMTKQMICGIIYNIVAAGIISYLLLKTKAMKFWGRVWFVTWIGIVVAILGVLPASNWWYFPINWVILDAFDIIIGWFLGGLVIAKLVKK